MTHDVDVIVVGAGQAGLASSYLLKQARVTHLVLERGAIGESWRSQRWDSFHLNTPNWANGLPGMAFYPEAARDFVHRDAVLAYFERYARAGELPIREHGAVTQVVQDDDGFRLSTRSDTFTARAVILASGSMSRPRIPGIADRLPDGIVSLSAGTYRNAGALPEGAVVVVGSGQSGCQIVEDLLDTGRHVYVCTSRVGRLPRTYRGREILEWWKDMGFLEVPLEALPDPAIQFAAQPQVSGTHGGHTVSLQSLARDGATLLGRLENIDGHTLRLAGDLAESIAFGDEKAAMFKSDVDAHIERNGVEAPPATDDPGEPPMPDADGSGQHTELDLRDAGVASVIWCTGFDADWSWVDVDVFDGHGRPRQRAGISDCPGLYFLGFPWLAKRKSGLLYGAGEDAQRIVTHIRSHVL